jgi:hypothetical protein
MTMRQPFRMSLNRDDMVEIAQSRAALRAASE